MDKYMQQYQDIIKRLQAAFPEVEVGLATEVLAADVEVVCVDIKGKVGLLLYPESVVQPEGYQGTSWAVDIMQGYEVEGSVLADLPAAFGTICTFIAKFIEM